jgi:hypothetical protein
MPVIGTGIPVSEHSSTGQDFFISISDWFQLRHFPFRYLLTGIK